LIELIKATLESGEDVLVSGFGKFSVQEKGQRKGRNPATGQTMMLRPRKVVTFRYSKITGQVIRCDHDGFAVEFDELLDGFDCKDGEFPEIVHESERASRYP
jgi:hypothetical protein